MKEILPNCTIDKKNFEFLKNIVEEEKSKGHGASRSAIVNTALSMYFKRIYGFRYMGFK